MANNRIQRINTEILRALSEIIRYKVKNTNLTEMVNVTKVDTTNDLAHCKVYVSIFSKDEEKKNKTFEALKASSGYIRHELAHAVLIRCVPELHFEYDNSFEYSEQINKVLKEIKKND